MFPSLSAKGVHFVRGQYALIAMAPGLGKSAFTLTLALKSGVPTLYFSADSDAFVQLTRSMSIQSGRPLDETTAAVLEDRVDEYEHWIEDLPIRFNYSASPSFEDIEMSIESFGEVYGEYPHLLVVDNITNVRTDSSSEDPFAGLESLNDYLNDVARKTEACTIGLHHVTGEYNDGLIPVPMSGLKGQIGRVPALVVTGHRGPDLISGAAAMRLSCVKFRGGRADPSGQDYVELEFYGDRMEIRDPFMV